MCRIAGLVSNRLQAKQMNNIVNAMCDTLQHGGPDDAGVFVDENAGLAFGHRRLSIIDLTKKGHQPMADVAQKAWITFNGEIYNYPELKKELLGVGARFTSNTDTEVIIQGYLYWGTACFAKLRGMFAFALYDKMKQAVYLVRDTAGIKPLYYSTQNKQLVFASEVRAFKATGFTYEADQRWPVWLLAYGHIPEPYTTLQHVHTLPKGHFLHWQQNGAFKIEDYTKTVNHQYITNTDTAREGISHYLQAAISRQLIADAPIGVFLSGGVDSSLISLVANQHKKQHLKTVSIFFNESKYDERPYQDAVLNEITGQNYKHLVKQQDFEAFLPQVINSMDMPTTDGINTWFISKYAREAGLKAVLSGIGGDELFGGYPSFTRIKYLKYLRKLPPALFKAANLFSGDVTKRFTYLQHNHPLADYLFIRGIYTPADIAKILDIDLQAVNEILFSGNNIPKLNTYDHLHAAWFETNLYMQNQLLRDTDVMSMSHGLEVRVPILDEDLQVFVNQIHPSIRFQNATPKKILVDSFKNILPEAVWNRTKMGFSFPFDTWMKSNVEITNAGNYRSKTTKQFIEKFKSGQIHWSRAFALYQIQKHV